MENTPVKPSDLGLSPPLSRQYSLTMSEQPVILRQQPPDNLLKPVSVPEPEEKKDVADLPNARMYKSLLHQYAQKSSTQPPVYQTLNEGSQHQPQFRSRVWIDGDYYTSSNTFSQLKAAEMEVSKIAFLAIMQKIRDAGAKLIQEDTTFCKSILIEYAVRMNLEKPSYQTTQPDASLPLFFSLLVFNGVTYTGDCARNKMEAQRLAARAVIQSILDTGSGIVMSEIINSKLKLHAAVNRAKGSMNFQVGIKPLIVHTESDNGLKLSNASKVEVASGTNNVPTPLTILDPNPRQSASIGIKPLIVHTESDNGLKLSNASKVEVASGTNNVPTPLTILDPNPTQSASIPAIDILLGVNEPPKLEIPTSITTPVAISVDPISKQTPLVGSTTAVVVTPPIIAEPPVLEQTALVASTSGQKRRRKNKKKTQKKTRVEAQLALDMVPLSNIPPCSVAQ